MIFRVEERLVEMVEVEAGMLGIGVSEWVRRAVEEKLGGVVTAAVKRVVVREEKKKEREKEKEVVVLPVGEEKREEAGVVGVVGEPAWKVRLAEQLAGRDGRGFVSSSGVAAPVAGAPVATPRSVVMGERTPQERAARLAAARSAAAGVKVLPQMESRAEFYPDEDPEESQDIK